MLLHMCRIILILALTLAPTLLAQTPHFGEAVPQTHTRYGAFGAEPRLVTNGQSAFLLWADDAKVRITKLIDGERRAGRPVLDVDRGWFDVVWTGSHFLVAAYDRRFANDEIRGRLLDANGEPIGESFTITQYLGRPRLAFDGSRVLMLYGYVPGTNEYLTGFMFMRFLGVDGRPVADPANAQLSLVQRGMDVAVAAGGPGFVAATATNVSVEIKPMSPEAVGVVWPLAATETMPRRVAVASDGRNALVVWTNGDQAAELATARQDGLVSGRMSIPGTQGATSVAAAWNGTKWVVSTITSGKLTTHLIDGAGAQALAQSNAHAESSVTVASLNGRTFAAWRGTGTGQPVLVRDVSQNNNGETAAFGAAKQTLQTATASHDASLIVWSETRDGRRTLHAGARSASGSWRENRIGEDDDAPLAASNGSLFLVIKKSASGWSAVTLTPDLQVTASTEIMNAFTPTGITWDGTGWVVIGISAQSNVYAARVMPWGAVSASFLIAEHTSNSETANARIMWSGDGYLAVWQDSNCMVVCDVYKFVLHGTRLTKELQRVDAQPLLLAPNLADSPDLYWDGSRYVIFWSNAGILQTRTMRTNASGSGISTVTGVNIDTNQLRVTPTSYGAAITSNDGEVLLIRDGALVTRYELGEPHTADALVSVGAEVLYVQATAKDAMPYHGASHVFLSAGGVLPPNDVPDPPKFSRASMEDDGNVMLLQWKAPVDPVNGYRIEYRVNDGVWNELDQWFDAATTSMSIRPWLDGARYHFRIRAYSNAGVSEYSMPATVRATNRRRAMR